MYITIAIVLAILALAFLLIPFFIRDRYGIKVFGPIALACLVFSVVSVMGSFFANPDVETKQNYVPVVNCIEEESEKYIVNAIWI